MTTAEKLGRPWGSQPPNPPPPPLSTWEIKVMDAVGDVIAFWGFKHNHGRIWALLYIRDESMTSTTLQQELGLSKGAVSMLVRDLMAWGIIDRSLDPQSGHRCYSANTDLLKMITSMIQRREAGVIQRAQTALAEAEAEAQASGVVSGEVLERIRRMRQLADVMDHSLATVLRATTLDIRSFLSAVRTALTLNRRGTR
jgi:DNA-binding transcriptional regulator GbsR (MarR family)